MRKTNGKPVNSIDRDKLQKLCESNGWYGAAEDECDAIMSYIEECRESALQSGAESSGTYGVSLAAEMIAEHNGPLMTDIFNISSQIIFHARKEYADFDFDGDANEDWYNVVWEHRDGEPRQNYVDTEDEALALAAELEEAGHYVQEVDKYHGYGAAPVTVIYAGHYTLGK